jgi:hypothetical protein
MGPAPSVKFTSRLQLVLEKDEGGHREAIHNVAGKGDCEWFVTSDQATAASLRYKLVTQRWGQPQTTRTNLLHENNRGPAKWLDIVVFSGAAKRLSSLYRIWHCRRDLHYLSA